MQLARTQHLEARFYRVRLTPQRCRRGKNETLDNSFFVFRVLSVARNSQRALEGCFDHFLTNLIYLSEARN